MTPTPEPVSWDVAERVARRVARRSEIQIDWATHRALVADFEEVTVEAEELVERSTGLRSLAGPARAQVASREAWIHANISSFKRLLGPVLERAGKGGRNLPGVLGPAARAWPGPRWASYWAGCPDACLGQYDLLYAEVGAPQDAVYFVGPNIVSLERRHGFNRASSGSGSCWTS